jgi:Glycosyl transferase family 2
MPSLNQTDFIAAAVTSVMSQGVEDLELVVVDGGSTDGTQRKLAALTRAYPERLRWRSGPDGGPAAAINQAAHLARGSVLGWLNSDDVYSPGAIVRALAHFERHPEHVMVYGHAEHIDLFGAVMEPYPTQGPDVPVESFAQGCFICQPSVFVRRDAWLSQGGLDETLGASFDFEMWLRMFKAHPGRIGFIEAMQAQSRLHAGGITLRMRERVAIEGLKVLRRHLGCAPVEWLLTHMAERCEQHPFAAARQSLSEELLALIGRAAPLLNPEDQQLLYKRLGVDAALQLATPDLFVAVHPDGWAPEFLSVRWRQPSEPFRALRLHGRHARPGGGPLTLEIQPSDGPSWRHTVTDAGPFSLDLELIDHRPDARLQFGIQCLKPFIPAHIEPGSADLRALAFTVVRCEPLH